jgi:hypothetical protein
MQARLRSRAVKALILKYLAGDFFRLATDNETNFWLCYRRFVWAESDHLARTTPIKAIQ